MLKQDITPKIVKEVKKQYEKLKSMKKVKNKVNKELWIVLSRNDIRDILNGLYDDIKKVKNWLKELNDDIKKKIGYEVTDDYYIFYLKKEDEYWNKILKPYPITIEVVDNIFRDYSKYWNNLSSEQILQKYEIKPELWYALKNRLRLYKDSHVLSPITLWRLNEEEREETIKSVMNKSIEDKYKNSFTKYHERIKNRKYNEMSRILSSYEFFLENIQKYIENYKPKKIDFEIEQIDNNDEITILFSDLHIGKMDTKAVLERIRLMWMDIIKRPEKKVNLLCLWDLFETIVQDGMHPNQKNTMDMHDNYEIVMLVVETLENLIIKLIQQWKEVSFNWTVWNHDRLTQDKWQDQSKLAWLLTYELIKRWVSNIKAQVNIFRERWNTLEIDDFHLIFHHGDDNATSKNPSDILWEKWIKGKHNIIVFWDKHHKFEKDIHSDAMKLIVPSLAGANEYDMNKLLSSYPWYIILEKDHDGTPKTITRRFGK